MIQRFLILAIVLILGCRSTEQTMKNDGGQQEQTNLANPGPGIAPDHCRIVGTIISVSSAMSSGADDPCSKAPCVAVIRVEEILGYGSSFISRMAKGSEISVQFRYTLGPTKALFPKMSPELPGLKAGSKFQADVQSVAEPISGESKGPSYSAGTYTVR